MLRANAIALNKRNDEHLNAPLGHVISTPWPVSSNTLTVGRFTVRIGLRPDNPAFPVYRVFLGARLIGKQFSIPSESDCRWLEMQRREERTAYATRSSLGRVYSVPSRGSRSSQFATAKNGTKR